VAGQPDAPHVPVLLGPLLARVAPVRGLWIDATFGAGGYTRGLLDAGADKVIAIDRDPLAFDLAKVWAGAWGDRIVMVEDSFAHLDRHADTADGVAMDLGVSSMQIDRPERGFSFQKDGPLDMRMSGKGTSAADIVNSASEAELADILYRYGEERASRRIARAIVAEREKTPITTTRALARIVEGCLPRPKPGQSHPATRTFQALRIAVNDEFGALAEGLSAAERVLKPGGKLAVVSFHSLEDRIVKRFLQARSTKGGGGSRYAPEAEARDPAFRLLGDAGPDAAEVAANPRSRSARLRVAERTSAPALAVDPAEIGVPVLTRRGRG